MVSGVFFKPVSLGLAIVILIQSIIWTTLSFLSILCYMDIIKIDHNSQSNFGLQQFTLALEELYLSAKPPIPNENRAVNPSIFNILMWIYFVLSLLLFFISSVHLVVLCKNSKPRKINLSTVIWQSFVYTVCLYDLITCILFIIDYIFIRDYVKNDTSKTELYFAVTITLIVLSAKGFILWILNFTLSVILSVIFRAKVENEPLLQVNPKLYGRTNAAYNAYGDVTLDPQIDTNSIETKPADDNVSQPNNWSSNINNEAEREDDSISSLSSLDYNYNNYNNNKYPVLPISNSLPRVPRARTDSYQTPRSLMSTNPSPIPEPSLPSMHTYQEPVNYARRQSIYENEEDDDDITILNSPTYLASAIPNTRRFNLKEPPPDY